MILGGWILMIATDLVFTVSLIWCMRLVLQHKSELEQE
jgi:hypothetical protein